MHACMRARVCTVFQRIVFHPILHLENVATGARGIQLTPMLLQSTSQKSTRRCLLGLTIIIFKQNSSISVQRLFLFF